MADLRRVVVLMLTDPQGDGRIRVFRDLARARRVARRWTGTTGADPSDAEWRGAEGREDDDAELYRARVE